MASKKIKPIPSSYGNWEYLPEAQAWVVSYDTGNPHNGIVRRYGIVEDTYGDGKRGPWVARVATDRIRDNYQSPKPLAAVKAGGATVGERGADEFATAAEGRAAVLAWFEKNPITRDY